MADLTDAQWERLAPFIPVPPRRPDGKGCPRVDNRAILNGILWVLRSGARWKDLPERRRTRPAIAGSRNGLTRRSLSGWPNTSPLS